MLPLLMSAPCCWKVTNWQLQGKESSIQRLGTRLMVTGIILPSHLHQLISAKITRSWLPLMPAQDSCSVTCLASASLQRPPAGELITVSLDLPSPKISCVENTSFIIILCPAVNSHYPAKDLFPAIIWRDLASDLEERDHNGSLESSTSPQVLQWS